MVLEPVVCITYALAKNPEASSDFHSTYTISEVQLLSYECTWLASKAVRNGLTFLMSHANMGFQLKNPDIDDHFGVKSRSAKTDSFIRIALGIPRQWITQRVAAAGAN